MDILQVSIMGFQDLSSWEIQTFYTETAVHCMSYNCSSIFFKQSFGWLQYLKFQ